jgi:hypothetical protein
MSEGRYILFDRASRNQLGEFDMLPEAEEALARFVAAAPEGVLDLEIWDDDKGAILQIDPAKLRPAPAA